MKARPVIVWFRRDLRISGNAALSAAAAGNRPLIAVYVDAPASQRRSIGAASRWWLHHSLLALDAALSNAGGGLWVIRGRPDDVLPCLAERTAAVAVHWNRLYTPQSRGKATAVAQALSDAGVANSEHGGGLLFEPGDVVTKSGHPYRVFTPFWRQAQEELDASSPPAAPKSMVVLPPDVELSIEIDDLGLLPKVDWAGGLRDAWMPGEAGAQRRLAGFLEKGLNEYARNRDVPGGGGTSQLSPHLHFGEISSAQVLQALRDAAVDFADESAASFLSELGWRDFAHHVLWEYPGTPDEALQEAYRNFPWRRNRVRLQAWQRGRTGYPVIDAGMRQLWTSGWMHNRVRMLVASFLVKDLLIPWQDGAAWFWDTLVDADLANNTFGWQWTAGCGADAAPYFRIFNPVTQAERYDKTGDYVRRWVPELSALPDKHLHAPWTAPASALARAGVRLGETYPEPIVDHAEARDRALAAHQGWRDSQ